LDSILNERRTPLTRKLNYARAGVDRKLRAKSKEGLKVLKNTYNFSRYGKVWRLPYGSIFPSGQDRYFDLQIEGVGTKVLIAQLSEKYDTIGIDAVAMAVNDVIRSGAKPLAIADNIHTKSSDPILIRDLLTGIAEGAEQSECIVPSGETGDTAEIIKGLTNHVGFDIVVAAIGEVTNQKVISGTDIKPGNTIIGMRSSGLHSNGISLARRILFKQWGGRYEPDQVPEGLNRDLVSEVLEPTKIYVNSLLKVSEQITVKAAVHITGDGYTKFNRLTMYSKKIGFKFDNFQPQPIFELIQETATKLDGKITDEEMFRTFNMGWGFAIVTNETDETQALELIKKTGTHAEKIGTITQEAGIRIRYGNKKIRI
jgi:phosphoribosylformylglycinamidine cyclo-ligase